MIRVIVISAYVFLFSLDSLCQVDDTIFKRFSIGLSYEPNYSNRQLNYSSQNKSIEGLRETEEIPNYGFRTGLNFRYGLSSKFAIETGLLFAKSGFSTRKKDLIWDSPDATYPIKSKTEFAYYYFEIPLKVNYYFKIGRLNLYATTGLSANNFLNRETTLTTFAQNGEENKSSDQQYYGFKADTYSFLLGFGMRIPISKRSILYIEPMYRHNFTSVVVDKDAKEYLYTIGLNTKLFYNFKRKSSNSKNGQMGSRTHGFGKRPG
jgi:hypothetical protein